MFEKSYSSYINLRHNLTKSNKLLLLFNSKECQKIKIKEKSQISFCKHIEKQMELCKSTANRICMNSHTIGFCPQTQKLELHYMSP